MSIYAAADVLDAIEPWSGGRMRSARLAAIIDRYTALADRRPELDLAEWGIVVQLLGPLASVRDAGRLWAEVLDRHRDRLPLPGVDAERLAAKLRRLVPAELVALLEVADRVALATGSLRERLAAAGIGDRP
jgi:hypothetical protein